MSSVPTGVTSPGRPAAPRSEAVRSALHKHLRKTAQFIKILDALTLGFAWLASLLAIWWLACVIDHWVLPLPALARWTIWLAAVGGTGWWTVRYLVPLLAHRINPVYAARRIENLVPEFKNGLVSWLELEALPNNGVPRGVMAALTYRAARFIGGQDPSATVDTSPLIKLIGGVLLLATGLVVYTMLSPKSTFVTGQRIAMPWLSIESPTRVHVLEVNPGSIEITQGKPLDLEVKLRGLYFDEPVFARYNTLDGQLKNQTIELKAETQGFRYTGQLTTSSTGVEHELDYWIEAGDARNGPYRITLSPLPSVALESIKLDFPSYTKLPSRLVTAAGEVEAVEGTRATIVAGANQPMSRGRLEINPEIDAAGELVRAQAFVDMKIDQRKLEAEWLLQINAAGDNPSKLNYRIRGSNLRGDSNPRPILHTMSVFADVAPEITLLGPDSRILRVLPTARVNLEVRALDPDFGLTKLMIEVRRNNIPAQQTMLLESTSESDGVTGRQVKTMQLNLSELGATLGDQFQILATAIDNRHDPLNGRPAANRTQAEPLLLQVVAPEQADAPERFVNPPETPPESSGDNSAAPPTAGEPGSAAPTTAEPAANNPPPGSQTPQPNTDQPNTGQPNADQPKTGQPNAGESAADPKQPDAAASGNQPSGDQSQPGNSTSGENRPQPAAGGEPPAGSQASPEQPAGEQSSGEAGSQGTPAGSSSSGEQSAQPSSSTSSGSQGAGSQGSNDQSGKPGAAGGGGQQSGNSGEAASQSGSNSQNSGQGKPSGQNGAAAGGNPANGESGSNPGSQTANGSPSGRNATSPNQAQSDGQTIEQIQQYMQSQQNSGANNSSASQQSSATADANSKPQQPKPQQPTAQQSTAQQPTAQQSTGQENTGQENAGQSPEAAGSQPGGTSATDGGGKPATGANDPATGGQTKPANGQAGESSAKPGTEPTKPGTEPSAANEPGSNQPGGEQPDNPQQAGNNQNAADQQAGKQPAGNQQPSSQQQPGGQQPGGQQPGGQQPGGQQPGGQQPGAQQPGGQQPGGQQPGGQQPGGQQPGGQQPGGQQPGGQQPGGQQPGGQQPGGQQPGGQQPGGQQPGGQQPGGQQPGGQQPGGQQPGGQQPGGQQPGGQQPGGQQPGGQQPGGQQPGGQQPGGQQPGGAQPGEKQPGGEKPDEKQPAGNQPGGSAASGNQQNSDSSSSSASSSSGEQSGGSAAGGDSSSDGGAAGQQPSSQAAGAAGGNSGQGGTASGAGAGAPQGGEGGTAGTGGAANQDYAAKTTELVLDYLNRQKDQPDPELLKELNWSQADFENFLQRWNAARDLSNSPDPQDRLKWQEQLQSLGLGPNVQGALSGSSNNDSFRQQQDGGTRVRPPESLRKQYEAFQKALQQRQ